MGPGREGILKCQKKNYRGRDGRRRNVGAKRHAQRRSWDKKKNGDQLETASADACWRGKKDAGMDRESDQGKKASGGRLAGGGMWPGERTGIKRR